MAENEKNYLWDLDSERIRDTFERPFWQKKKKPQRWILNKCLAESLLAFEKYLLQYFQSTWQDQILSLKSRQRANTHIWFPYGWIPTLSVASEAIVSLLKLEGTRPDQRRCITPASFNSYCSTWPIMIIQTRIDQYVISLTMSIQYPKLNSSYRHSQEEAILSKVLFLK